MSRKERPRLAVKIRDQYGSHLLWHPHLNEACKEMVQQAVAILNAELKNGKEPHTQSSFALTATLDRAKQVIEDFKGKQK